MRPILICSRSGPLTPGRPHCHRQPDLSGGHPSRPYLYHAGIPRSRHSLVRRCGRESAPRRSTNRLSNSSANIQNTGSSGSSKEAGPQLLLQAFLQRIVNSGGRIEREYGLGRMRTDLLLLWPAPSDARPDSGSKGSNRMQTTPQKPGTDHARGPRTDPRLHGSLRRDQRTSRHL